MNRKIIYLNNSSHRITVSNEAFEEISHFVELNKVCDTCGEHYDSRNPMVRENMCLGCFVLENRNLGVTYLGLHNEDSYGAKHYKFLSEAGYIYFSSTQSDSRIDPDVYETLKYWNFPIPDSHTVKGKEIELNRWYWKIWGDFEHNSIVVIEYQERYGDDRTHAVFLSNKEDKTVTELNKRKSYIRGLFARAKEEAEKTKEDGLYHIHGNSFYSLWDSSLYAIISDLATEDTKKVTL